MGLTVKAIEQAKPRDGRWELSDGRGLRLVVHPSGEKSWVVRFRSPVERDAKGQRKSKKLTLGPLALISSNDEPRLGDPLTLTQARALAMQAIDQVRREKDPTHLKREQKAQRKREARSDTIVATMIEFLERYRGKKKQGLRETTRLQTAGYFGLKRAPDKPGEWVKTGNGVLKRWAGRSLQSITKRDAIELIDNIADEAPVSANRTLTVLKTFGRWAEKRDLIPMSPFAQIDAPTAEASRERTLSDTELAAIWKAASAEGHPFGTLCCLLILTGARRDELREATWSEFDLEKAVWKLPAARAKNGREHHVPLTRLALDILKAMPRIKGRGLLFTTTGDSPISGLSRAKNRLDAAALGELRKSDPNAVLNSWTQHDFRRTLASALQRFGFSIEVVEACLNHKSGTLRGVAGIYARHDYLPEKTEALEVWAKHVEAIAQ